MSDWTGAITSHNMRHTTESVCGGMNISTWNLRTGMENTILNGNKPQLRESKGGYTNRQQIDVSDQIHPR